ncbi:MAG TPA: FUSC family protein, partial [Bryobacteraceae bacterium]|nr:FUSC family protein [Bryobacteraceae bacterium]
WPWRRYEPERRIVASLYRALADVARTPGSPSNAPPLSDQISDAHDALASLGSDHGLEAERLMLLLNQAERIRLSILSLGRLTRRIGRAGHGHETVAVLTRIREATGEALDGVMAGGGMDSFTRAAHEFDRHDHGPASPFFAALIRDAGQQVDALGGQLRTALGTVPRASDPEESREPWRLRFSGRLAKLEANLSLGSTAFRHALRLAVCLGIGDAAGRALSLQRTYWIPMTIAIVLKPDFTATFSRGILRIAGTFAGLILATTLFRFLHTGIAADIALMALFTFLLRWIGPANYGIFVTALSALVVLLIATTGVSPREVIAARAINTAAGGLLAMVAYALWPTWERTQTGPVLADMIEAYRGYFAAVIEALAGGNPAAIERIRIVGRRARSNAEASVDRMRGEPGVSPEQFNVFSAILVNSHSFVHAVMALESGLYRTQPVTMRPATAAFAAQVDRVLAAIENSLRNRAPMKRDLPDLREAHNLIVGSHEAAANRYTLVNVETDRVVTSLNTVAEQTRLL